MAMGDSGERDDRDDGENGEVFVIRTFADLLSRPNFVPKLSLDGEALEEVKSEYHFAKKEQCGISSCRTWHNWGLLVGLASGKEINIGNDCGQGHFPELYDKAHRRFTVRRARRHREDEFAKFQSRRAQIQSALNEIWKSERAGLWAHECRQVTREVAPQCLLNLRKQIESGDYRLEISVRRTEDDIPQGFGRGDRYRSVQVGFLDGAMAFWVSPHELLNEVQETLDRSDKWNYKELPARMQRTLMNALLKTDANIERATAVVEAARTCFDRRNLEQLHLIAKSSREEIEAFIKRIEQVPTKRERKAG